MAGGWPISGDVCNGASGGANLTASCGTVVTTGATANTKGAWTQLVASSPIDCCFLQISIDAAPVTVVGTASVDIGIGASGSEIAIISNLMCAGTFGLRINECNSYLIPIAIPAGTRISARAQINNTTQNLYVSVCLFDGAFTNQEGFSIVDTYGFNAAATQGATIDPGATVNTKGSYTQITSSTSYDLCGFLVYLDTQNQNRASAVTGLQWLIDIAVGASGSEVPIVPNMAISGTKFFASTDYVNPSQFGFLPISIPASTRIAARAQCNNSTSPQRLFGLTLYGVRA